MKLPKNLSTLLLAVYLILAGLAALGVSFPFMGTIIGVVALVAGVLYLLNR
jgi:uncharacterized membrane protein HdeD (DUF308 family)